MLDIPLFLELVMTEVIRFEDYDNMMEKCNNATNTDSQIVNSPACPNKQKAKHKPVTPSLSSRPGSHDLGEYTSP